jgi:peptide/nickel transport system substrate-binding protein
MLFHRRDLHRIMLFGAVAVSSGTARAADQPPRGGTVSFLVEAEPPTLVAIAHTAGGTQRISPKITEGLLTYDLDFQPIPVLATSWDVSEDGLLYKFKLREGVKWHDGKAFTAEDVAYSLKLLKESHPRGRATFANVNDVQTPDPYTVVLILSKPAPYLLNALDASESPIVAKHIYEGTDVLTNKNAAAPVGTGPFIFKEWARGSHVIVERNPDYWDTGKPYLDRIVFRFIPDEAARAAAFEAKELDIGGGPPVARSDIARLAALPHLGAETRGYQYNGNFTQLFFNFDTPILQDKRVRLAIAHSIDQDRLLDAVWYGYGKVATTAISPDLAPFHDASIARYGFNVAEAERLLDEAGHPRKADGRRFILRLFNNPYYGKGAADFLRQGLTKVGIGVDLQIFDFSTYINRTYTGRNFDLTIEALANTFDPTLGVQRVYWSKNFKIGLPFSNASHYNNPEADRLLEAASIEPSQAARVKLWKEFQQLLRADVAAVDLIAPQGVTIFNKRVKNHTISMAGINASFANVYVQG